MQTANKEEELFLETPSSDSCSLYFIIGTTATLFREAKTSLKEEGSFSDPICERIKSYVLSFD